MKENYENMKIEKSKKNINILKLNMLIYFMTNAKTMSIGGDLFRVHLS